MMNLPIKDLQKNVKEIWTKLDKLEDEAKIKEGVLEKIKAECPNYKPESVTFETRMKVDGGWHICTTFVV